MRQSRRELGGEIILVVPIVAATFVVLLWAGTAKDRIQKDATCQVFKSWRRTWRRLGHRRGIK